MEYNIKLSHNILAEDSRSIPYRPAFNNYTKSVTASILLQQIFYRWFHNNKKPFYKFAAPCNHELYKDGDSWQEELNISPKAFRTALSKIAFKKNSESKINNDFPVEYWITPDRKTYFQINEIVFNKLLGVLYQNDQRAITLNDQRAISKSTLGKIDNTDITTENKQINNIYAHYPNTCAFRSSRLKRGEKDKKKIQKLLQTVSAEEIKKVITNYIDHCNSTKTYYQNLQTFLNNFAAHQENSNLPIQKTSASVTPYFMDAL